MTFDLERILKSKEALRNKLTNLPIEEKLRMLDALGERTLILQQAKVQIPAGATGVREDSVPYSEDSQPK